MKVILNPAQLAQVCITEEVGIDLPADFAALTPPQHKAWARQEIEATALAMFRDMATAHGTRPSPEQETAYLRQVQPGIDAALGGSQ